MDQVNDLLLPLVGDTDASMETSALAALALGLTHVASAQEDAVEAILQVASPHPPPPPNPIPDAVPGGPILGAPPRNCGIAIQHTVSLAANRPAGCLQGHCQKTSCILLCFRRVCQENVAGCWFVHDVEDCASSGIGLPTIACPHNFQARLFQSKECRCSAARAKCTY